MISLQVPRLLAIAILVACTFLLGACGTAFKAPVDKNIAGLAAGVALYRVEKHYDVDCSFFNIVEAGEFCLHRYKATDREEVHCFRTLGGIDCYAQRDPYLLAGRQLPAAPKTLADPAMPMDPRPNRLRQVVDTILE